MEHRIKEIIKEKGYKTQQEFADKLGITRESLSRILISPSYPTLEKVAIALEVPMWQLFASPEDVKSEELTALIQHKGDFYKANTIAELEKIVGEIKEKSK